MYIFPIFVIFAFLFSHKLKKSTQYANQHREDFLDAEQEANFTRKKDIEHLDYITIPLEKLPFFEKVDKEIEKYQNVIKNLAGKRILNLTGISNTELKKMYGAANLTALSEYDDNYSTMVSTLAKWGNRLMSLGYEQEAVTVLELGIKYKSDVTLNYTLLAGYYAKSNNASGLEWLRATAGKLNSLTKQPILNMLEEASRTHQ